MNRRIANLLVLVVGAAMLWLPAGAQETPPAVEAEAAVVKTNHLPATLMTKSSRRTRSVQSRGNGRVLVGENLVVETGETVGEVVLLGGSASIDGTVGSDLVVVGGKAKLGPTAEVKGDVVIVGGKLEADPSARINGDRVLVGGWAEKLFTHRWFTWPQQWVGSGLLLARPFPPQYGWAWLLAGCSLILYLVIAMLFPRPLQATVDALHARPGSSVLVGLLAMLLGLLLLLLLVITGVGILLVPFVLVLMLAVFIVGKAAVYRAAGFQVGVQFGLAGLQKPAVALIAGCLFFLGIYMIPVLGFVVWLGIAPLAIGSVLLAPFRRPALAEAGPATVAPPVMPAETLPPVLSQTGPPNPALLPRVGFWLRCLATLLDAIALVILSNIFGVSPGHWFLPLWIVYHVALWAVWGTTLGGAMFGLKIIRPDGRPINFGVALVRCLASFFSFVVFGLGFFWAGWTSARQSWHDQIAGTVIVKLPKGVSPL
jgi:uncharacterized RDD family membrane protein YckC